MANTLKFGSGQWATKVGSTLAYNDENGNFKPLPFNFTRSTSGTRVNKDGLIEVITNNKPRIDFLNDSNGALLLEPTSSNAITYSEDFSQTSFWNANSNVTILKNYKSPDGTLNASKIIPNTTNSQHSIKATGKLTNSRYNYTIYVKASGNSFFQIANQSTSDYVNFNLNNGTYFASNSNDEVSVDYFGDGWYRCNVYFATTFQGIYNVIIENIGSTRLESFVGNDVDGIYIWGAQAEANSSYATSIIPTQGAISTRVAEVCSQTPPSGIIGQTEGTIFAHFKRNGNIVSRGGVVFLREDFLRGLSINYINNTLYAISRNDAATTTVVLKTPFDINETAKVAITYNGSVFSGFLNGVKIFTDSVFNPFDTIVTEIRVSYGANSGSDIEIAPNSMKDVRVYTTVLTDQECINLTTL
jgi:hypothetical protein